MIKTKTTAFIDVFNQKIEGEETITGIEVPIIQRDYAQGRISKEVTRIRNQFVNALLGALKGNKEDAITLDFVYGNVEKGKLIPLDGQQRLTTLFLLHWYISKKEKIEDAETTFLSQFTYRTRFSSNNFCNKIVACSPDFKQEKLSDWIIDQNWFMYSWEKDPTVRSMLVMIDKIHETFKNENDLWDKLTDSENPPIGFYFLPLKNMGLSDSLYIKMNSRGKPLTNFEHFKADFEKTIKTVSEELYRVFIQKVDIEWVDMLWKFRNERNSIDDRFMNYFRFISEMISHEQGLIIEENDFDLANAVYGIENNNAVDNLKFLFASFDCWLTTNNEEFFSAVFSNTTHIEGKVCLFNEQNNLFSLCCSFYNVKKGKIRGFSLNNALYLYGTIQYLTHKQDISEVQFTERIRILRNLVANSQFEIRIDRFKTLLADVKDLIINGHISEESGGFGKTQKIEEKAKQNWRVQNPTLVTSLNKIEDHKLLEGSVTIIDLENTDKFNDRVINFNSLFNGEIKYTKISRAMLTLGDYSQLITFRFLLGGHTEKTWRDLLRPSNQRRNFKNTKTVLSQLLNEIKGDTSNYLQTLIEAYKTNTEVKKDWRYYFVKYPAMRQGSSGCYNWYNDNDRIKENPYKVWMMNTPSSLSGRHWSPFLYTLSEDERIKEKVSLGEYGDKLVILNSNQKIECKSSYWSFTDNNDIEVDKLIISQESGIDIEDRIEKFITYFLR